MLPRIYYPVSAWRTSWNLLHSYAHLRSQNSFQAARSKVQGHSVLKKVLFPAFYIFEKRCKGRGLGYTYGRDTRFCVLTFKKNLCENNIFVNLISLMTLR